jgi:uncharacterized membrane protein
MQADVRRMVSRTANVRSRRSHRIHPVTYYLSVVGLVLAAPALMLAAVTYTPFDYNGRLYTTSSGTVVRGTATITEAFGINDRGKIVGGFCADGDDAQGRVTSGCSAPGASPSHGYLKDGKGFRLINFPGAFETEAIGINNEGTIVGLYDPVVPVPANADLGNGFWCESPCKEKSDFHKLVYPGATSTDAAAINNYGDIVGLYSLEAIPPFLDFGWMRDGRRFCSIDIGQDIPGRPFVAGAIDTNSLSINDHETVVGSFDDSVAGVVKAFVLTDVDAPRYVNGKPQPCRWETVTTFAFPGAAVHQTEAMGVNNRGLIVGNYLDDTPAPDTSHAFQVRLGANGAVDPASFATIDFAPPAGGDNAATAVNNRAVIVGNFEDTRPPFSTTLPKERAFVRKP